MAATTISHTVKAQIHPFAVLSISDYIAKHTLRSFSQPLAGILLGRYHQDRVEVETAFEIKFSQDPQSGSFIPNQAWVDERYQQFIDVYSGQSPLSFVGWWYMENESHISKTLKLPSASERPEIPLAIRVDSGRLTGSRGDQLPFDVVALKDDFSTSNTSMDLDKSDSQTLLDYEILTGDTELIAMEYVAKSPANAVAIASAPLEAQNSSSGAADDELVESLTSEEEEMISFLTTKINAIRMLKSRVHAITTYLASLPPSYLSDPTLPPDSSVPLEYLEPIFFLGRELHILDPNSEVAKSSSPELILEATRDILTRLENISIPKEFALPNTHTTTDGQSPTSPAQEVHVAPLQENLDSDNLIINLMSQITQSSEEMRGLGSSYAVLEAAKQEQQRNAAETSRRPPKDGRPDQMFHPADAELMMED